MDLFDATLADPKGLSAPASAPLAVRMRPKTIDDVLGQDHLLAAGSPLRRLVAGGADGPTSSVILWGPPGTGKTTLAYLVAAAAGHDFAELSAVSAGVAQVRDVVQAARRRLATGGRPTVLFIDEVHRFSKSQQDALLPSVENQWVTLVAATTENPSFSIISPLLSRSILLTLKPLEPEHVEALVRRAVASSDGLGGKVALTDEAVVALQRLAGGDARKALTVLEAAAASVSDGATGGVAPEITPEAISEAIDVAFVRYDRAGDQHYDVASAFIKSMRGSDVDAALHYLARMVAAGEDPRFIARRIVIAAAEEVGMADPSALQTAVAAAQAVAMIGMPEARIILAEAVVHVATAPKSNASYLAIDAALADVRAGKGASVPVHLRDTSYSGAQRLGHGAGYQYAHDAEHAVAPQRYLPDDLAGARYYAPNDRGYERQVAERLAAVRAILAEAERRGATRPGAEHW